MAADHTEAPTMKPVLVLQNLSADGPGYLGQWLAERGVPMDVRNTEAGEHYPATLDGYAALALLGGEMSANDPLPSLRAAEALFLQAMQRGVPTIGHCLGAQLMARALGAAVTASPAPEVGWQTIDVADTPLAQDWLGDAGPRKVFHWHYEAFGLPPGAQALARSSACRHQAFAVGPHLAMQFHVEVDAAKLARWTAVDDPGARTRSQRLPSVQSFAEMRADAQVHLVAHQHLARRVYARWLTAASD